jgi:hypothetical protein
MWQSVDQNLAKRGLKWTWNIWLLILWTSLVLTWMLEGQSCTHVTFLGVVATAKLRDHRDVMQRHISVICSRWRNISDKRAQCLQVIQSEEVVFSTPRMSVAVVFTRCCGSRDLCQGFTNCLLSSDMLIKLGTSLFTYIRFFLPNFCTL